MHIAHVCTEAAYLVPNEALTFETVDASKEKWRVSLELKDQLVFYQKKGFLPQCKNRFSSALDAKAIQSKQVNSLVNSKNGSHNPEEQLARFCLLRKRKNSVTQKDCLCG